MLIGSVVMAGASPAMTSRHGAGDDVDDALSIDGVGLARGPQGGEVVAQDGQVAGRDRIAGCGDLGEGAALGQVAGIAHPGEVHARRQRQRGELRSDAGRLAAGQKDSRHWIRAGG